MELGGDSRHKTLLFAFLIIIHMPGLLISNNGQQFYFKKSFLFENPSLTISFYNGLIPAPLIEPRPPLTDGTTDLVIQFLVPVRSDSLCKQLRLSQERVTEH